MPRARNDDAEAAGQVIGAGIAFTATAIIAIVSFVGGLLGWLLLQTKKVYKCVRCGFILDRA